MMVNAILIHIIKGLNLGDTPTIAQDQQMEDGEEADDSDQEPKP